MRSTHSMALRVLYIVYYLKPCQLLSTKKIIKSVAPPSLKKETLNEGELLDGDWRGKGAGDLCRTPPSPLVKVHNLLEGGGGDKLGPMLRAHLLDDADDIQIRNSERHRMPQCRDTGFKRSSMCRTTPIPTHSLFVDEHFHRLLVCRTEHPRHGPPSSPSRIGQVHGGVLIPIWFPESQVPHPGPPNHPTPPHPRKKKKN